MRVFSITTALLLLLVAACNLGERYEVRFDFDGGTLRSSGAQIMLCRASQDEFTAMLIDRDGTFAMSWMVDDDDPSRWRGKRYRGTGYKTGFDLAKCDFAGEKVGILIEITDVNGRTVSGRFSGNVGLGDETYAIDNGSFRAPVLK